jgi:predicted DCC family thiol-disulfide oxidoreductase YuxK
LPAEHPARNVSRVATENKQKFAVLYDGACRFCTQSAKRLARFFGPTRVMVVNFQDDGVLDQYPTVTYAAAMNAMHVIAPDGRVYPGAGGIARLLRALPIIGIISYLYYLPIIKQLADIAYRLIAKNRYRLFGKQEACDPGGTCHLH